MAKEIYYRSIWQVLRWNSVILLPNINLTLPSTREDTNLIIVILTIDVFFLGNIFWRLIRRELVVIKQHYLVVNSLFKSTKVVYDEIWTYRIDQANKSLTTFSTYEEHQFSLRELSQKDFSQLQQRLKQVVSRKDYQCNPKLNEL